MTDRSGVLLYQRLIQRLQANTLQRPPLVAGLTLVEQQLLALMEAQPPRLLADPQEDLVFGARVHDIASGYVKNQQVVALAADIHAGHQAMLDTDRRIGEVDCCLELCVTALDLAVTTLNHALPEANNDRASVGVGHADQVVGQVPGRDPLGLAIKPLILGDCQQSHAPLLDGRFQRLLHGHRRHKATLTFLEW